MRTARSSPSQTNLEDAFGLAYADYSQFLYVGFTFVFIHFQLTILVPQIKLFI